MSMPMTDTGRAEIGLRALQAINRRIKVIHVGKRQLGLTDDEYRALLAGATGKSSCEVMTLSELGSVLRAMRAAGFTNKRMPPRPGEAPLCSPQKLYYIKGLWELAARNKTEAALNRFVKRIVHVDNIRFLDDRAATRVILALRDIAGKAGYDPDGPRGRGQA